MNQAIKHKLPEKPKTDKINNQGIIHITKYVVSPTKNEPI